MDGLGSFQGHQRRNGSLNAYEALFSQVLGVLKGGLTSARHVSAQPAAIAAAQTRRPAVLLLPKTFSKPSLTGMLADAIATDSRYHSRLCVELRRVTGRSRLSRRADGPR